MNPTSFLVTRRLLRSSIVAVAWVAIAAAPALAQTFTWDGGGASGVWSDGSNWDGDSAPAASTTAAVIFAGSTNTTTSNDIADLTLSGITFDAAAAAFTLGGGTATLAGDITFSGLPAAAITHTISMPLVVDGTRTIATQGSGNTNPGRGSITIDGVLSGSGGLLMTNNGTLTLNAANTFSGGLTFGNATASNGTGSRGMIVLGNNAALGTGKAVSKGALVTAGTSGIVVANDIDVDAGGFRLGGSEAIEFAGDIAVILGSRTFSNNSDQVMTISGSLLAANASHGISFDAGHWALTGTNTYSSKLTATGGNTIVTINSTASLAGWDQTGRWATTNNGTLAMPNSFAEADIVTMIGTGNFVGGRIGFDTAAGDRTFTAAIADNVGIRKLSGNTLTLSGVNTNTGSVEVSAGSLRIGDGTSGSLASVSAIAFRGTDARLVLDNPSGQTLGADLNFTNAAGGTLEVASGAVTWNPVANPDNSGPAVWTVAAGSSLAVGTSGGGTNIGFASGDTFTLGGDGDGTIGPSIASGGAQITVIKEGAGTWTLSNPANGWGSGSGQGGLVVNAGTLRLGADDVIPNGSTKGNVTVNAGGTLDLNGRLERINALLGSGTVDNTAATAGTLEVGDDSASGTFAGTIANSGGGAVGLTKLGDGTITLTGTNTYTGKTQVTGGTLAVATLAALGSAPAGFTADQVTLNGGMLQVDGNVSDFGNRGITIGASGGTVGAGEDSTIGLAAGAVAAASGETPVLTLAGTGTVELPDASTYAGTYQVGGGSASTWDGLTGVKNGFLVLGDAQALGGSAVASRGIQLQASVPGLVIANDIAISAGGLRFGGQNDLELSGSITFDASRGIGNYSGSRKLTISGPIALASGQNVTFEGSNNSPQNGTTEFSGVVSGDGQVVVQNTFDNGLAILSGANTYTGSTTIQTGTLSIASVGNLGTEPGAFAAAHMAVNAGTLRTTATINGLGNRGLTLGDAASTLEQSAGTTLTLDTVVDGSGGLTKLGDGTLVLSAANTFSGTTRVSAGTLQVGNILALQNSTFDTQSGSAGTLSLGSLTSLSLGGLSGSDPFPLANDSSGAVAVTIGGTSTSSSFAGSLTGAGSLDKAGSGTLTLSGVSSYTGVTTINAGTLAIASGDALGANPATFAPSQVILVGGQLQGTADADLGNRGLSLTAGSSVAPDTDTTLTVGGLSGSGGLALASAGTLALPAASAGYSGPFDLGYGTTSDWNGTSGTKGGFLLVGDDAALGSAAVVSRGAQLQASTAGVALANGIEINTGGLRFGGANELELAGTITLVGGNRSIGNYSGDKTLTVSGGVDLNGNGLTIYGNNGAAANGTVDITGVISGSGSFTLQSTFDNGRVVLGATNTYTGQTVLQTGTLSIAVADNLGADPGSPTADQISLSGGTLETTASIASLGNRGITVSTGTSQIAPATGTTLTVDSGLAGSGSLVKLGGGTLLLTTDNTSSGGLTASEGTVQLGDGGTTGTAGSGTITIGDTATVIVNRSDSPAVSNAISFGAGEATLAFELGGSLSGTINTLPTTGTSRLSVAAGQTLVVSGTGNIGSTHQVGSSVLLLDGAGTGTLEQSLASGGATAGGIRKDGTGTWTISNPANNWSVGPLEIRQGSLLLGASDVIPHGFDATNGAKGNVVLSPDVGRTAVLDMQGFSDTINGLVSSGAGTAVVDNTAVGGSTLTIGANDTTSSFGGAIRGTVGTIAVVKTGTGTLTLSGASDYAGGTTVSGGTLRATAAGALGTGNVSVDAGASLWLDVTPTLGGGNGITLALGAGLVTEAGVSLPLTAGSSLAGWSSASGSGSTAALLAATADAATTLSTSWGANPGGFLSDILDLSGTTASATNLMTLAMGYGGYGGDLSLLNIAYRTGGIGAFTDLGTSWQGTVPFDPVTHTTAGMYGVNSGDQTVWVVTDHNSEFGVVAVPEPEAMAVVAMGLAAAATMLGLHRRVAA